MPRVHNCGSLPHPLHIGDPSQSQQQSTENMTATIIHRDTIKVSQLSAMIGEREILETVAQLKVSWCSMCCSMLAMSWCGVSLSHFCGHYGNGLTTPHESLLQKCADIRKSMN